MSNHPIITKTTIAIICITALAITAIIKGQDGGTLAGAIAAITGLGGFVIGKATKSK